MFSRHSLTVVAGLLFATQVLPIHAAMAQTTTVDAELLEQLQRVILEQQEQLQKQSEQLKSQAEVLESLQQQVKELKDTAADAHTVAGEAKSTAEDAVDTAEDAVDTARKAEASTQTADDKVVRSGQERITLAISGQVNRMINVANDGDDTKVYHVDNDNSSTRIRFVGTGHVNEDISIGTNIEAELQSNDSSTVNQNDESEGSVSFNDRVVEATFKSKMLGMISIGQGWTASDSTSEVDLSGTSVVSYSSVSDLAGGLFFFDSETDALTTIQVKDVFSNLDGLGRKDRLRYDTPNFYGFTASASTVEDQQYDAALRWGAEVAGFRAGAAVAYSDPKDSDYRVNGSASALHLDTGLNLTFAAGLDDPDEDDRDDAKFWYVKGGWLTDFFDIGKTAFSVDYTETADISADGDDGQSFGAFVVQNLAGYGTEFYGGVRVYDLDSSGLDTDKIIVGNVGTRVKF